MLSTNTVVLALCLLLVLIDERLFCAAAFNKSLLRTIGGQIAFPGQIPHQVVLMEDQQQVCGGSLISETMVLTAAHCIWGVQPSQMEAIVGGNDYMAANNDWYKIAQFIIHPQYIHKKLDYDIGLIRLSRPVRLGGPVQKILLADSDAKYPAGSTAIVSGYGAINYHYDKQSFLRYAQVPVWSEEDCHQKFSTITKRNICAGTSGRVGNCQGDSGGPLTVGDRLYGVVSWGYQCGKPGPIVYSYVPAYRSWIYENSHI